MPSHPSDAIFFKSVEPLGNHRLRVCTCPGEEILFDFTPRLVTTRFADLQDDAFFDSVLTDGASLIFNVPGHMPIQISAGEFLELLAKKTAVFSPGKEV